MTIVLAAATLGLVAIWVTLALQWQRGIGWFAVLAALDTALLTHLVGVASRARRMLAAMTATVATIGLALALLPAIAVGQMLGLTPQVTMARGSPALALIYLDSLFQRSDWFFMVLAVPVAGLVAFCNLRRRSRIGRPAPG